MKTQEAEGHEGGAYLQLILIRHPESNYNAGGNRYCGRTDAPLSDEGKRQVERLVRHFSEERVDAVWSSPLTRALTCAERIAEVQGLKVRVSEYFTEFDFGAWEGMRPADIAQAYPEAWQRWNGGHPFGGPPGGERPIDVYHRVVRGLEELVAAGGDKVVLVCHDQVIRMLFTFFLNMPYHRWRALGQPKNASLSRVRTAQGGGTWHMIAYSQEV